MRQIQTLLLFASALLAGCAVPGAPQPPSLGLPQPVSDLRATRKGDRVLLTWTRPLETSDGERLNQVGVTRVCRSVQRELPRQCLQVAGEVEAGTPGQQAVFVDHLPAEILSQDVAADVTYSLETLNPGGRSAGMSQAVRVPLVAIPPPPEVVEARVTQEGIVLTWHMPPEPPHAGSVRTVYRVFRRATGAETDVRIAEVPASPSRRAELRDPAIEWGQTYQYRVTPVVQMAREGRPPLEIEGGDSKLLEVAAEDRFPPAVPVGLQAVAFRLSTRTGSDEVPGIAVDLNWSPSLDQDVAGYNVWRREGSEWRKLNAELVKTPAYRDAQVQPGTWEYSVSAVDLRENESARSETATEEVPETRDPASQP